MTVDLLVLALVLGVVDPTNPSVAASTLDNATMKASDEESRIGAELRSNLTSVFWDDDEDFQELEDQLPPDGCRQHNMDVYSQELCIHPFHSQMQELRPEHWCNMEKIIRLYNEMTVCIEGLALIFHCFYPSRASQDLFLSVHSSFFHNCTKEEVVLQDAPQWLVVTLTLVPVSLIPVLTYVVVWKSKVQE